MKCQKLECLPSVSIHLSSQLDIVFLIDASASIGDKNFLSELKFVKKLLADLSISENETRVAVITFSDEDKVVCNDEVTIINC